MDHGGDDVYNTQKVADYYYDDDQVEDNNDEHGYYSQPVEEDHNYVSAKDFSFVFKLFPFFILNLGLPRTRRATTYKRKFTI